MCGGLRYKGELQQQRDHPSPAESTPDGNSQPPNPEVHSDVEGRASMELPRLQGLRRRRQVLTGIKH